MTTSQSLLPGLTGSAEVATTPAHSALSLGSGTVDVYATPAMVALMERAAVECVERHLPPGQITLGILIDVSHREATAIGQRVTAEARLVAVDGRKLTFEIEARDSLGVIGSGRHVRMIVDRDRFLARLVARSSGL